MHRIGGAAKNLKGKFDWVIDRPDFRYVGPMWGVAEGYHLVDNPEGESKRVAVRKTGKWRPYAPLQEPDLFLSYTRLASRGKPTARGVLRWITRYGLPRKAQEDWSDLKLSDGELNQAPVSVEEFAADALEARGALDLYTDLSSGGVEALRKRIGLLREDYSRGGKLSRMNRYFVRKWGGEADKLGRPDGGLQFMATARLDGFVEAKLEGVRPALWSDYALGSSADRYAPAQSWRCPDLASAVYLQFYLLMTNGLAMRRCDNPSCGMPIPITRKNRRFCNSTCRSNMRHHK